MKATHFIIVLVLNLSFVLCAQHTEDQIKQVVDSYLPSDGPGLAILATQDQHVLYKSAFGLSNISNETTIKGDDLFRIGSVTKQFTAVAILKLAHQQKLDLEDAISKYIPEIPMDHKITIDQLLNHTSGLGNQNDVAAYNNDQLDLSNYPNSVVPSILESQLKFVPGSAYSYSNLGYILLGEIIERVSGMSYESYLRETFFDPLEMRSTGFEYEQDGIDLEVSGYSAYNGEFKLSTPINTKLAYAAGGLISSLQDLAIWNRAVMSGSILPLAYVEQIQASTILPSGEHIAYSLGWQIGNIQGVKTVKHDGIVNGFTSMVLYIPESNIFVAVLSNCDEYRDIEHVASKIAAILINRPFLQNPIDLSLNDLESFQGKFVSKDLEMSITLHDSILMYYGKGGAKKKLIPLEPNLLQVEGTLDQLKFNWENNESLYTLMTLNDITEWDRVQSLPAYQSVKLDRDDLTQYTGQYQVPNAFVFNVVKLEDKLYGSIGSDQKEISCFEVDRFVAIDTDASLHFLRDEHGEIDKLVLNLDRSITAHKID